jgi:hypothetical protein
MSSFDVQRTFATLPTRRETSSELRSFMLAIACESNIDEKSPAEPSRSLPLAHCQPKEELHACYDGIAVADADAAFSQIQLKSANVVGGMRLGRNARGMRQTACSF